MKKLILIAACAMCAGSMMAQRAGSLYLGNTFEFGGSRTSSGTDDKEKSGNFSFSLNPEFGYFLSDKFSLGFQATASLNVSKDTAPESTYGNAKHRNRTFSFGPVANYYVGLSEKLYWAPKANVTLSFNKSTNIKDDNNNNWNKSVGFGFGVNLANFEYRATDRLYVSASLGLGWISFRHSKATKWGKEVDNVETTGKYDDNSTNSFSWGIDNTISAVGLGFKYTL